MSRLLIQCLHIFKSFDSIFLFEDLSFSINQGEIFALIGENGAGKTTLLRLLAGEMSPDSGTFSRAPHLSIGLLPQEVIFEECSLKVRDYIEQGILFELEQEMEACLEDPKRLEEWGRLHQRYEELGGYRKLPLKKTLKGLKLDMTLLDQPMASLSSGQRVRVALAKALNENPDLLLLDEPTNHLDKEMLEWLKEVLLQREGATMLISHDRKFLNETCNRLIEIHEGKLTCYGGNYDFYLEERKRLLERQIKAYEAQEKEKQFLKQKIKAMTFSKSKPAPPKDRNVMAYDRHGEKHQKSMQRSLDQLKERLLEIQAHPLPNPRPKNIKGLRFISDSLRSSVAVELENVEKRFGDAVVFSGLDMVLRGGDRILLTGPNGSGKTTLLKCIAGLLSVDGGNIRYAKTARIGYLDQEVEYLPMTNTPLQYFEARFGLSEEKLRRELDKAAIGGAELLRRSFSSLSVGQRKRFMLLSLVLEKPNVLLLDEPTNHLDFLTLEAFEKALLRFDGAVLAVSHDALFIEKIKAKSIAL